MTKQLLAGLEDSLEDHSEPVTGTPSALPHPPDTNPSSRQPSTEDGSTDDQTQPATVTPVEKELSAHLI